MNGLDQQILFITDIHQNIKAIKKIDFSKYDNVFCGGDLLDPTAPNIKIAKEIINILPNETYIVPGNCDKDPKLIEYMQDNLKYIHKKLTNINGIPLLGIGYCRDLKEDMKAYRKFFLEDNKRIFDLMENNKKLSFIIEFCGIKVNGDNSIEVLSEEEALELSKDFISKFDFFEEIEITDLFSNIEDLSNGIILSHSPPFGYLDKLDGLPHIGAHSLKYGIKKTKPKLVLCGHFHEFTKKEFIDKTTIFNPGAIKDNKFGVIIIKENNIWLEFKNI